MSCADEEGCITNSLFEFEGSSRGFILAVNEQIEEGWNKLEVQPFQTEKEACKIIGKFFNDEVVEVEHLEDFKDKDEGIGSLEEQEK